MTPLAEARLLGRAVRRFDIPSEKIDDVLNTLHTIATDASVKPSARVAAATGLLSAEAMNQKDEHKLLSMIGEHGKAVAGGNRFLEPAQRLGIETASSRVQPDRPPTDS